MKDHLRKIKQNLTEAPPNQNTEDGAEKDEVGYLMVAERPIAFPGEPFQEEKSGDKACQIRSAIPTDANIPIESDQKWVEVMNVEREPHRRHERSGAAKEFKELVGQGSRRTLDGIRSKVFPLRNLATLRKLPGEPWFAQGNGSAGQKS
jgi:hypothetical protein